MKNKIKLYEKLINGPVKTFNQENRRKRAKANKSSILCILTGQHKPNDNLFKEIFNASTHGMCVVDQDFNIVQANETLANYFDESLDSIKGQKCFNIFCLEKCHTPECPLTDILQFNDEKIHKESIIKRYDEPDTELLCTVRALRNGMGKIVGILKCFTDITELKKAEIISQQKEDKFQSYISHSPDGIFVINQDGNYIDVNPAGCEMLGYSKDELLQMKIHQITHNSLWHFHDLLENGISHGEIEINKKDGTIGVFDIRAVALNNGLYIGYKRDVTKRNAMERALKNSERSYDLLLNGMSDTVILCKVDKGSTPKIIKANKAFLDLLCISDDDNLDNEESIKNVFPIELVLCQH